MVRTDLIQSNKPLHVFTPPQNQPTTILDKLKKNPLFRVGVQRNINPEFNQLIGHMLGGRIQNNIDKGNLQFQTEIPGFNSNRFYLGMKYQF